MGRMTPLIIDVSETDLADLEDWARNSEQGVGDLLKEALRHYMEYIRAEHAMYKEARKGPSFSLEEVRAHLAERRKMRAQAGEQAQAQAAE